MLATDYQRVRKRGRRELGGYRLRFGDAGCCARSSYRDCGTKFYVFLTWRLWPCSCIVPSRSMDQISVLAAGGMRSRMQSLDVVANNLSNSSTSGYKSDGEFYSMFASEVASDDGSGPTSIPTIEHQWTDFAQGLLEPTNNPLDFGISGKG